MNSPLTDRDFAEIRSNVLREIERRKRRGVFVLSASVVFAVLALVFVLVPRPLPRSAGEGAGATQTPGTQKPPAQPRVAPAPSPAETVIATQTPPKHHHPKHHHQPPPVTLASYEQKPYTIELHTANPDIRIIWIAK